MVVPATYERLLCELRELAVTAAAVSFELCDSTHLAQLVDAARSAQRCIDGLIASIGCQADILAAAGTGAPATELLRHHGQVRSTTARREVARSKLCQRVPGLAEALRSGLISGDHADSFARHTKTLNDHEWDRLDQPKLLADASRLPADTFDAVVKRAANEAIGDGGLKDAQAMRKASEFRHWIDRRTGMGRFSGSLDPERYEAMVTAVDQHTAALAAASTAAQSAEHGCEKDAGLAATALVGLVTSSGERNARLAHITVVVDEQSLSHEFRPDSTAQTGNGHDLSHDAVKRLACDSTLQKVVLDRRGLPIDVGRRYRTATDTQWTAIRSIYSSCGWNNCDRPLSHCQLHHIKHWSKGGPTNLANLLPLCNEHHHLVHEGQWHIEFAQEPNSPPGRRLTITRPDGTHHSTTNPPDRTPALNHPANSRQ